MPIPPLSNCDVFLGGDDLEMREIRLLLQRFHPDVSLFDKRLAWGARVSQYRQELERSLQESRCPLLVELTVDMELESVNQVAAWRPGLAVIIDHHNELSGPGSQSSLEQICQFFQISSDQLSVDEQRRLQLVVANDVGHIASMLQLQPPATVEEVRSIRLQERRILGISEQEERRARNLIESREVKCDGKLITIKHDLAHTAAIVDFMSPILGGPGFVNLVVYSKESVDFFGERTLIQKLTDWLPPPNSWSGGSRIESGYWGAAIPAPEVIERLENWIG